MAALSKNFNHTGTHQATTTLTIDKMFFRLLEWDKFKPVHVRIVGDSLVITQPLVMPPDDRKPMRATKSEKAPKSTKVPVQKTKGLRLVSTANSADGETIESFYLCPICSKATLRKRIVSGTPMFDCRNCDSGQLFDTLTKMGAIE